MKKNMSQPSFSDQLLRFQAQSVLFDQKPKQLAVRQLELPSAKTKSMKINVWRNHTFETTASLAQIYAHAYGVDLVFEIGDYDDTLSFTNHSAADVELIWLDPQRYTNISDRKIWLGWIEQRLQELRRLSAAPIILMTWAPPPTQSDEIKNVTSNIAGCHFADAQELATQLDVKLLDKRTEELSGTPLSSNFQTLAARTLFCHWLTGATFPPIKTVAIDLDNTLHDGILGEDGINGIKVTESHQSLHRTLLSLKDKGIFLALVSRNEIEDVENLFLKHRDYVIKKSDFSVLEVSWGSKANAIQNIASQLRIGTDSILFIDDNIGELAEVSAMLPDVQLIAAQKEATITNRALEYHPAVWRWTLNNEDTLRINDLKANVAREKIQKTALDQSSYFQSIGACLTFWLNPITMQDRLASLSAKTNQFNLALHRFNTPQIHEKITTAHTDVIGVGMRDNLSDSGIIALIVLRRENDILHIDEICISCRAMGRGLENAIISEAIRISNLRHGCTTLRFKITHAPRNRPALKWLESFSGAQLPSETNERDVTISTLDKFPPDKGILIERHLND